MNVTFCNARLAIRGTTASNISARCLSSRQYPASIGSGRYQEGDAVLLSYKDGRHVRRKLTAPLKPDGTVRTGRTNHEIKHADIIGKPTGRLYVNVRDGRGKESEVRYRVTEPSFEQFVAMAPRTVTPIYASYSASMVNFLDIHVTPPQPANDPITSEFAPLEIMEAGTGHGSLTVHLSRAIAAANPPPPTIGGTTNPEDLDQAWEQWRSSRRAVVHTIEFNANRSREAADGIKAFRGGLYWPHIDFHSGDAGTWVRNEQERRKQTSKPEQFLDIVCLDLPDVQKQIEHVVKAMKEDAKLLVYVPQITQLAVCQHEIDRLRLPLLKDQVIELGEGISNGRVWDLRFTRTRASQKTPAENLNSSDESTDSDEVLSEASEEQLENNTSQAATSTAAGANAEFPMMVCRPMVGKLVIGGAFIGLWTKRDKPSHKG